MTSADLGLLEEFGLSSEVDLGSLQKIWGSEDLDPSLVSSPLASLKKWLLLLPESIQEQVTLALRQELPFMPPNVTPEVMAEPNMTVPSMNHIEIIYRCLDFAMKAGDYHTAAALVYVVDRACYRFGRSAALLRVVEKIRCASRDVAIAPQVILRQARVMKDSGDLHTAMRILDAVVGRERKWDYKDDKQYENTKAVCVQIKGQILHNLGLWKEAVPPLVESVRSFMLVNDNKGTSSSLALLSRCLKKLQMKDYQMLQGNFADMFPTFHPFFEAYQKGVEAVRLIESLGATVYLAHSQLVADESLLMFTIHEKNMTEKQKLDQYQVIVDEMKKSLAYHRTVHHMQSLEVYLAFVRAIFMISLTLHFSPIPQDTDLARFLEKLTLEMYAYMCQQVSSNGSHQPSASLRQNQHSVRRMNGALALLGLPLLEGSADIEQAGSDKKWSEIEKPDQTSSTSSAAAGSDRSVSTSSLPSSRATEVSSVPSMSWPESQKSNQDAVDSSTEVSLTPANKAMTFPAVTASKFRHGGRNRWAHRDLRPGKFVGLAMSTEDVLAATCPALGMDTGDNVGGDATDGSQDPVDVESLMVSADSIAFTAAGLEEGGNSTGSEISSAVENSVNAMIISKSSGAGVSESSDTVDQLASTKSSSSATADSSEVSTDSLGLSSSGSSKGQSGQRSSSATVDQLADTQPSRSGAGVSESSATVDQSASTKSSSSATADSSEVSTDSLEVSSSGSSKGQSGQRSASAGISSKVRSATVDQQVDTVPSRTSDKTDPREGGDWSPIMDVSSVCNVLADLELGSSVETSDSSEFLAHFVPSDNRDVHRAVLMTYSPVAGQWSGQTTLAYQGPLLKTDKKGSHRDAFHVSFLHQDEPLGRYVGKRYRSGQKAPEEYMRDVVCQMLAGFYVTRFNQALQHCPLDILQVQFLSAAHLQLLDKDGKVFDWINVEPFLHGSFLKLTNNLEYVSTDVKNERGVEVATALSHFSYAETQGALMMVDLQGWIPADGKGVVYLTDPVFHTRNMKRFSTGDRH